MNLRIRQALAAGCLLLCAGCATARVPLQTFDVTLIRGNYEEARQMSTGNISRRNSPRDLLWTLQAAALERMSQNYAASNAYFDKAEDSFAYYDQQLALGRSAQSAGSLLFNDSALPYTGKNYDRIMVNTYKALNHAVLGDTQSARLEFNRALQRQSDAKQRFAAQVANLNNSLNAEKNQYGYGREAIDSALGHARIDQLLREKYSNLDAFKVYADFVNPFATYMAGLFFWLDGDTAKAVDILKEAYGMSDGHPVVAADFNRATRGETPKDEAWIIFENGLAPRREEVRVDLPILIEEAPIFYVGTAFPNLLPGLEAYPFVSATVDNGREYSTELLSSMDAIISAEFKKELRGIMTREIARVALKTYFQYEMRQRYGTAGGIISGIYQAATTRADLRMWSALPKEFQITQIKIPPQRRITIRTPGKEGFPIIIPADCRNVIIYIRLVSRGVEPVIDLIKF
ncbi:MAG: hypothetical protein K8I00_03500 [Candidatus Omnitrophica bacterium]|nr:hypothetical protein [Candidatus Omnitrophota bacterium]